MLSHRGLSSGDEGFQRQQLDGGVFKVGHQIRTHHRIHSGTSQVGIYVQCSHSDYVTQYFVKSDLELVQLHRDGAFNIK